MSDFERKISAAAREAVRVLFDVDAEDAIVTVETPKDPKLGDYATSAAMKLARTLHRSPLQIAEPLAEKLQELLPEAESVTVAKPGFINFKLKSEALSALINQVIAAGDDFGKNNAGNGKRVLVEWV